MIPHFIIQELIGPYGMTTIERLARIERHYRIYEHGSDFEMEPVEDYVPAKLKSKQVKNLIDKQASFAFGKTPEHKISCLGKQKDSDNQSAIQGYIDHVLKQNQWSGKLVKGAKDCFIGGRVALKVNVSNDNISIAFVPADGFVYETSLDDVDVIERIVFFYTIVDDKERERQRIWVQKYWMEKDRCYLSERIADGNGRTINPENEVKEKDTGFDRIPAYVIVNGGLSGDTEGESDVETIAADDSWYNRMRSANLDSLRKGMNQITYIVGANGNSIENFRIAPGALWDIQPEASFAESTNIQVGMIDNGFSYSTAYDQTLSDLKQEMHDVLGVPDLSLETMKSIITSGKAMKAVYWPLVCRCEEKMAAWKPALEWLTDMIVYSASVYPALKKTYGEFENEPYEITIDNQYPLPEDEDAERELDMQEVLSQNRSRKSYLMKWGGEGHKGLSSEDADTEIEQMAKERQVLEDSYIGDL